MSPTIRETNHGAADLLELLGATATAVIGKADALLKQLTGRKEVLGDLSDRQLDDIGIDPWSVRSSRPRLEVDAGLMTNLMSLR